MNENHLRKLPKVELHRHLDGSVRFDTIVDLAKYHNIDLGVHSTEELLLKTKIKEPMKNLEDVLATFMTTQKVLYCYDAIKRITFENVEDAFRDGVKLLELRFAPVYIAWEKKLAFDEIMEAVLDGISQGMETYDIQVGLIHILPRPLEPNKHEISCLEFLRYKNGTHKNAHRLCGFDLADSETTTQTADFVPYVDMMRKNGVGITIHTGENTDAAHVIESIEAYNPARIGHGIKTIDDQDAMRRVIEKNIHLELNLTSNVLTNSVESAETHPLPAFYSAGIPISINSDDPHIMDIDLVDEYELAARHYNLTAEDFDKINKQTLTHSFLDKDIKTYAASRYFDYELPVEKK
ncbi:MAG: adenosine deaminase [bacterium]|nr:adenosine deaminase [bacterium]